MKICPEYNRDDYLHSLIIDMYTLSNHETIYETEKDIELIEQLETIYETIKEKILKK